MYVDLPAIIIQQINDGRYLSVRRKCRAIRHVQWSMPHHGPADTKRCQSFAGITFHHFMNQRNRDSATGSAYRVTECDRATIDIDPTLIPLKHLANRKRLCSKRFISLDKIDFSQLPAYTPVQRRVAYTGAIPINAGSTPTLANARMRASTGKFNARALASLIIITAAAPSFMDDALPAVTEPRLSNEGFKRAKPSALASVRGCSSVSTTNVCPLLWVITGTISSLNRPASIAARAFVAS